MALVDAAVATGQLGRVLEAMGERREERTAWDYYLAKVDGTSFEEFRASTARERPAPAARRLTQEEIIRQTLAIAGVASDPGGEADST